MQVDPEKHKDLMVYMMGLFKSLETQLLAYQMFVHALKVLFPADYQVIDDTLQQALDSPALQQVMNQKYDAAVEMLKKRFDEAILDEELSKWIRDWKQQTPPV
jgi:hypothetical protein